MRGLREAATSHGKEAGVRGRQPPGKAGVRGRLPPGIRLVLLLPRCGLLDPLYPVGVRSAPSQLPTEVVA